MPTIKIDGREIPFEQGDTVIRAAHRAGIDIPHYCWHPGLSVAANCRMCLVEVVPNPAARRFVPRLDILAWDETKKQFAVVNKPKLQPACQLEAADGLEVLSEKSPHVTEARKTVQEFLLLNHPVDCPICDQAGECRLQDYWLEHGRYRKRMHDEILHKPKAVSFGPTIVYDAERCIVCTRCVRFTEEIAKDPVLEKRERGNLGEIFVAPGRQLDHNYTLMTEHVCPVGALTSKDFRFKARVWFLRSARSVCQGCATGCNAYLDFDPRNQTAYRYRPRENQQVNKYWMCDVGMLSYARAHQHRIAQALVGGRLANSTAALDEIKSRWGNARGNNVAVVLSAQHNVEDNFALATFAAKFLGTTQFYLSGKPHGEADAVLYHADKNPNTRGAREAAGDIELQSFESFLEGAQAGKFTHVLALGPDTPVDRNALKALSKLKALVVLSAHDGALAEAAHVVLPASAWSETEGTYVNAQGLSQKSEKAVAPRGESRPAWEWISTLAKKLGHALSYAKIQDVRRAMPTRPAPAPTTTETTAAAAPAE